MSGKGRAQLREERRFSFFVLHFVFQELFLLYYELLSRERSWRFVGCLGDFLEELRGSVRGEWVWFLFRLLLILQFQSPEGHRRKRDCSVRFCFRKC